MIVFTLATGVTELRELQSETSDQDPCSSPATESARPTWGAPSLPYLSVGVYPYCRSGSFRSSLGKWGAACVRWRFGSCARRVVVVDRAVVVGHGQATSRLIRSCSIEQGASHRFRARLICIKWKRERNSRSTVLPSPISASFLNRCSLFFK